MSFIRKVIAGVGGRTRQVAGQGSALLEYRVVLESILGYAKEECAKEEKAVVKSRAVELWSFALTERLLGYGSLGTDHETLMEKWDQ